MFTCGPAFFGSAVAAVTDPHFSTVVLLCHCNGANGSTTFTNVVYPARGNTLGANAPCEVSTTAPLFGSGCASITGPSGYLASVATGDYGFVTNDFTIEFAFKTTTPSATENIFDSRTSAIQLASTIYIYGGTFHYYDGTNDISGGIVATSTWQRLAYSRNGTTGRLFVDGTQVASYTDNNNYPNRSPSWGSALTARATGFFDELRINNGVGRYTFNYTPDIAPFPDS